MGAVAVDFFKKARPQLPEAETGGAGSGNPSRKAVGIDPARVAPLVPGGETLGQMYGLDPAVAHFFRRLANKLRLTSAASQ
jgi:hypothetical protein